MNYGHEDSIATFKNKGINKNTDQDRYLKT
jgi:hypothetical protein